MPTVNALVSTPVSRSIRCRQLESMFDVPPRELQTIEWTGEVPLDEKPWSVGLIVGASGSGKTTVARELFGADALSWSPTWGGASVLDDFPKGASIEDIAAICQAVGFNTIPAWLRPYSVLSNGEKFRVSLARGLMESPELLVVDEFTSVVDRQVAQIGSYAVQKHVRREGKKFVAVSCHYDVIEWLNPDWILEPATMSFSWRELQRRPQLDIEICRVDYEAWRIFAPFHYLTAELSPAAQCYALFLAGRPAAFVGVLHRPHATAKGIWGVSRVVTLPDYQGLGLAFVLMESVASAFAALGKRFRTYSAHPALTRSYDRSTSWKLGRKPGLIAKSEGPDAFKGAFGGRPNATFEYVGPAMSDPAQARALLQIRSLS